MFTLSKPIGATQALKYHREEFSNAQTNYYTEEGNTVGEWHGALADSLGLTAGVREKEFALLSEGRHPFTGERLVNHQLSRTYTNVAGEVITSVEHRAGWDGTFSAPKSVSIVCLVGGDERIRRAHKESVDMALDAVERFAQARMGGNNPAIFTGEFIAAQFHHDSSRPVDGYAAPQLHDHCFIFNIVRTADGKYHSLQPLELYRSQQFATAVYRSELAIRLRLLGYELERGEHGQPEIKGFSKDYLEACSPRRQQIQEHLQARGLQGAAAAQIAAHTTREAKRDLSRAEVRAQQLAIAERFGDQPRDVVEKASQQHGSLLSVDAAEAAAASALTYSCERNMEREATVDERRLLRDALNRAIGDTTIGDIKKACEQAITNGELIDISDVPQQPLRTLTTREMQECERHIIESVLAGQRKCGPLVGRDIHDLTLTAHQHLSDSQRSAVSAVLENHDQVMGLEGRAGTGKTTSLTAIYKAVNAAGYRIKGLAPTARAAQKLAECGAKCETLQRHLTARAGRTARQKRFFILDESSLASSKQMLQFLATLSPEDRVLLVGDTRQHESVEAGRPYAQLQEAGMRTVKLNEIVRQKNPELKRIVEQLAAGETEAAIERLRNEGGVHEIRDRDERICAIASHFVRDPANSLIVSPDNGSRFDINKQVHRELQALGMVDIEEIKARILIPRQDLTGPDRAWSANYREGDVLRYAKSSDSFGIHAGQYSKVSAIDCNRNVLTVKFENGRKLEYDPRRLQGVVVYREEEREFSRGDRIQLTLSCHPKGLANREFGTIVGFETESILTLRVDSGETVQLDLKRHPHVDYGYAVTSHSSQGQTTDRVLIQIDSEHVHRDLINSRMAYVSISRARNEAHIFTNDSEVLPHALNRDVSHRSAIEAQSRTAADCRRTWSHQVAESTTSR